MVPEQSRIRTLNRKPANRHQGRAGILLKNNVLGDTAGWEVARAEVAKTNLRGSGRCQVRPNFGFRKWPVALNHHGRGNDRNKGD